MRGASLALQDYLRTRAPCWIAELFSITLADGVTQFLWTSFDENICYGGSTWSALGSLIKRSRMTLRSTVEVPELEVALTALDSVQLQGIDLKLAVHNGVLDGARLSMQRVFMPAPGDTSLGPVLMFGGRISQAVITAAGITFTAKGDNVLMNQQTPRNLYQTTCLHTFCDSGCTLLEANYTIANSVGNGATTSFVPWGTAPSNPALFVLGKITFNAAEEGGGVCAAQVRSVRNANSKGVYLTYPLYGTPNAGDAFSVLIGCARSLNSCQNRTDDNGNVVDNSQNFRGEPWVPQAEYGV
ncbi:MAG: DUF2163 domain-containing protein [Rhizomicrobium sp.]